jgi:hypothetical protein
MNTENLIKPKYKVIADYPNCPFEVGHTLIQDMSTVGEVFVEASELGQPIDKNWLDKDAVTGYPHLFKRLEWWEEISPEEMPEYLKTHAGNSVRKVLSIDMRNELVTFVNGKVRKLKQWHPATLEEYNEYQSNQSQTHHSEK